MEAWLPLMTQLYPHYWLKLWVRLQKFCSGSKQNYSCRLQAHDQQAYHHAHWWRVNAPYPKMMMTIDHNTNIYSAWQNFNERLKVVNRVARGWGLSRALGCVQVPAQLCCGPPLSCTCPVLVWWCGLASLLAVSAVCTCSCSSLQHLLFALSGSPKLVPNSAS